MTQSTCSVTSASDGVYRLDDSLSSVFSPGTKLNPTWPWRCTRKDNVPVSGESWAPTNQRRLTAPV